MSLTRWLHRERADYRCQEFVEAVTDYLDDVMPAAARARFERHLSECDGCEHYLAQIRRTVALSGRLTVDDVEALGVEARDRLLDAFRSFHATS
jgi:anti-sigma factor RsiW